MEKMSRDRNVIGTEGEKYSADDESVSKYRNKPGPAYVGRGPIRAARS